MKRVFAKRHSSLFIFPVLAGCREVSGSGESIIFIEKRWSVLQA